jgi:hypothetical protein
MSKIHIKFVCPKCNSDQLIEQVSFHYDPNVNEMVRSFEWHADTYFCVGCSHNVLPTCIDFNLKEQKNA